MNETLTKHPRHLMACLCLIVLTLILMACSGCGTIKRVTQPFIRTTNVTATVVTVPATRTAVTNGTNVTVTITPESAQTNYVTNIVVAVNPALTGTIETASGINSTLNPTPTAPFINIGLTALSGILGLIAAWKTKRANREANANKETSAVFEAVVTGIEVIQDPVARAAAKASVTKITDAWGVRNQAKAKIDALTP